MPTTPDVTYDAGTRQPISAEGFGASGTGHCTIEHYVLRVLSRDHDSLEGAAARALTHAAVLERNKDKPAVVAEQNFLLGCAYTEMRYSLYAKGTGIRAKRVRKNAGYADKLKSFLKSKRDDWGKGLSATAAWKRLKEAPAIDSDVYRDGDHLVIHGPSGEHRITEETFRKNYW